MTRHGMVEPSAAGARPPASDPCATSFNIAADRVATGLMQDPPDRAEAQRSGPSASTIALPGTGCANADIGRRSKSP